MNDEPDEAHEPSSDHSETTATPEAPRAQRWPHLMVSERMRNRPRSPRRERPPEDPEEAAERGRQREAELRRAKADTERFVTPDRPHPTIGWSGGSEAHDVTGHYRLCTTCSGLKADDCGMWHWGHDKCPCEGRPENESLDDYEHRMPCLLCRACGLQITRGHYRMRFLVCTPCRDDLAVFNGQAGRKVLPQGLHSLVNGGPLMQVGQRTTKEQFGTFAADLNGMFSSIGSFHDWGTRLVLGRLRSFGFEEGLEIPVEAYLDACRAAGIDRRTGWRLLEEEWFTDA